MELVEFDPALASEVSGWATAADEVGMWCSRSEAPVPSEVIAAWGEAPDVRAFGLVVDDELVGYGELWVDDEESEVELARLIIAPVHRGRGLGQQLVRLLTARARTIYPAIGMRVHPSNTRARRTYERAGYSRVAADVEHDWNQGQPVPYVWMVAEGHPITDPSASSASPS